MPEIIIGGNGNPYQMNITSEGAVPISGVITISGGIHTGSVSVNVDSIYVQSGTMYLASGDNLSVTNRVAGSIVDMPDVTQGTNPWVVLGSQNITNFAEVGSVSTQTVDGTVSVTDIATAGSLATQGIVGSVNVTNFAEIGSLTTQNIIGSVNVENRVAGSIVNMPQVVGISGTLLEDFTLRHTQRIDYDGDIYPVYIGMAAPGTLVTSASWQIRKMTYSGTTPALFNDATLWASGNVNYDKVWDNRSGTNEAYS